MSDKLELKKEPGIYIFTNKVNGKKYVGETLDVKDRFKHYKNPKKTRPFEHALAKYGFDGFDLKVMYFPGITKGELLDLEETFILLESSLVDEHGYNICERGQDQTGKIVSSETRLKISNNVKISMNAEVRKKVSESKKGKPSHRRIIIQQFSKDGKFINEFASMTIASKELYIRRTYISKCCNGEQKTAGGYVWKKK